MAEDGSARIVGIHAEYEGDRGAARIAGVQAEYRGTLGATRLVGLMVEYRPAVLKTAGLGVVQGERIERLATQQGRRLRKRRGQQG